MSKPVYVKMLGSFLISHNGKELPESKLKMKQLITLLTYMIYNRDKHLFLDNIYSVLWPEENSDNPAHALRNLIYRMRTILKQNLDSDTAYIVTLENNSYSWNKGLNTVCDAIQFEAYIDFANDTKAEPSKRIENYTKAVGLYVGDFLINLSNQDWIVPIATYYRHMYSSAVYELAGLLIAENRYDEALRTCLRATEIDQFDERAHQHIIEAYRHLGKSELAASHYQHISNLFYKELGVELSNETTALYRKAATHAPIEIDIRSIRKSLSEDDDRNIPLFCDYDQLKTLFSLQMRNQERIPDSQYLLLITLSLQNGKAPPSPLLKNEIEKMTEILKQCLRRNDVVTFCTPAQFLLMLSSLSYENAEMVKGRIDKEYRKEAGTIQATYSFIAID